MQSHKQKSRENVLSISNDSQQGGIAGVFNRSAATYDQIGPQIYGYFGQRLVEIADVSPRSRVLDVATGRGAILLPLASEVGPYGKVIGIALDNFVGLKVTECEPGIKGDTATGATKPATLETGTIVQVPLFVNQDESIKIDTRTGDYSERA